MTEEGRFSRAMSKAGEGGQLGGPPPGTQPLPAEPAPDVAVRPDGPSTVLGTGPAACAAGEPGEPGPSIVMYHDKHGQVAHEIRAVRGRIMALSEADRPRVLLVTSSDRAEGKTTLAVNLAAAFCETGEGRVVVVDGDIPAPSLLEVAANVRPSAGLVEALRGDLEPEQAVYRTRIPNLDVIPCLPAENLDGVDQLVNEKFPALIEKLRGLYAYVIVDAPPVHVGQACTFAAHSDGVLLVAELERVRRHVAKHAVDQLVQSGAKVLGCVLTKRRHHVPDFLYRFFGTRSGYYYYGYGYSRRKALASRTGTGAPKAGVESAAPAAGDREEEG